MSSDRCSWVQVVEPKSKEYIYVNLGTGECLWEAPSAVSVKKSDNNEWWELFDKKTGRFYYYNTHLQTTVWHRPVNCDIIPLAKLQMVKCESIASNNEEVDISEEFLVIKKEMSTQTAVLQTLVDNEDRRSNGTSANMALQEDADLLASDEELEALHTQPEPSFKVDDTSKLSDNTSEKCILYLKGEVPTVPPRSPRLKADPCDLNHHQPAVTGVVSRQHHHHHHHPCQPERHSHPEATRHPVRTLQREITYPYVPQRSLESPLSPFLQDSVSDLPRSFTTFRPSSECQVLSNEFTSSLAHLPLESFRPACFLRQESFPATTAYDSSLGFAHESGTKCNDNSKVAGFKIAPTSRPRAFPRTNPSFVGTYRRERPGTSYSRILYSSHHAPSVISEDCKVQSMMPSSSRLHAANQKAAGTNFDESVLDKRCMALCHDDGDSRKINTTFGTISKKQLSLWSGKDGTNALSYADPCVLTGFHVCEDVQSMGDGENFAHSSQTLFNNRYSDQGLPVDGHLPYRLEVQHNWLHNGLTHADRAIDDALVLQMRRRSEPEYVNVPSGHIRTKLGTNNVRPFFGANFESLVKSIPGSYPDQGRESQCSDPPCIEHVSLEEHGKELSTDICLHSSRGLSPRNSDGLPDVDCEDSDRASAQSTPSPQTRQFQVIMPPKLQSSMPSTYHPSLRKKKWLDRNIPQPLARQSTLEKDWLVQTTDITQHRPVSMLTVSPSDSNVIASKVAGTLLQQMHIEQFVLENLNEHRKGILGKTVSVGHMLSWTKDVIQKPMIRTTNKSVKKEAPEVFKLILMYMGDRKTKDLMTQTALDIIIRGWMMVELRDEIFIQLCRQTSKNPRGESTVQGWELLGICLAFFPPSSKFHSFLDDHIHKSIDAHSHADKSLLYLYMVSCQRRLQWVVQVGAKRGLRKPMLEDIEHAKKSLLEPSMFGSTLEEIMNLQKDQFPERRLPWIQIALSEEVLKLNGTQTEGIFRVPGDIDEVNALKVQCDKWNLPTNLTDPHLPASLLKLWYRELYEPLVPYASYSQCLDNFANPEGATAIISTLPEINRLVFMYLIRFLQEFAKPEYASVTKMDVNNLAMVMAPNCLRCLSNDPKVIFENTRREMGFIRTLIQNLDTSTVKDLL